TGRVPLGNRPQYGSPEPGAQYPSYPPQAPNPGYANPQQPPHQASPYPGAPYPNPGHATPPPGGPYTGSTRPDYGAPRDWSAPGWPPEQSPADRPGSHGTNGWGHRG